MNQNGLTEGRDYLLDVRWAEGDYTHFAALAFELLERKSSVIIVTTIAAARAAQQVAPAIPIVMTGVTCLEPETLRGPHQRAVGGSGRAAPTGPPRARNLETRSPREGGDECHVFRPNAADHYALAAAKRFVQFAQATIRHSQRPNLRWSHQRTSPTKVVGGRR